MRRLFQLPANRRRIAREVEEEMHFHLVSRVEELMGQGLTLEDARVRAHQEYGDVDESRRELVAVDHRRFGRARVREYLTSFVDDIRYAARSLLRRPSTLPVTLIALVIGISANVVMFGVVDQVMLRAPAGVRQPEGVKRIYYQQSLDGVEFSPVTTYPVITMLREHVPAFSAVAGFFRTTLTMGRGVGARSVDVELVSGNYFQLLGVLPAAGRTLLPSDDVLPRGEQVVVVSDRFWKAELAGATNVVGSTVVLSGKPFQVAGIAPPGFSGIDRLNVDLWIPLSSMAEELNGPGWHNTNTVWWVQSIGRTRENASDIQASIQATAAYRQLIRGWGQGNRTGLERRWRDSSAKVVLGSVAGSRTPNGLSVQSRVSLWLSGVSAVVLLIACANVANVLIVRTLQRRREISVRLALGITRSRLVRMLLVESTLLAMVAASLSLILVAWSSRIVQQTLLPGSIWSGSIVDGRIVACTIALAALTVILTGVAPALHGLFTPVAEGLKASATQFSGGRSVVRTSLLVAQAALSIVLLIGAGLFVHSLRNATAHDAGIDLDRVVRVTMGLSRAGFDASQSDEIFRRAEDRLRAVPGVEQVSVVRGSAPLTSGIRMGLRIPGMDSLPDLHGRGPYVSYVQGNLFQALGARIVRGRTFTEDEVRVPSRTMIVNEMFAKAFFGDANPVGQCVIRRSDSLCTRIIGVVQNIMLFSAVGEEPAMAYLPGSAVTMTPQVIVVRISGNPSVVTSAIRGELQQLSANMPYPNVATFGELIAPQLRTWRVGTAVFTMMGGIALVIAVVGLYSVMTFMVSNRTHEIGIRMALGANQRDVVRLVGWQSMRAIIAGLLIGTMIAAFASRFIGNLLYETSTLEPTVYLGAGAMLAFAAAMASVAPSRRATAVDPAHALRGE